LNTKKVKLAIEGIASDQIWSGDFGTPLRGGDSLCRRGGRRNSYRCGPEVNRGSAARRHPEKFGGYPLKNPSLSPSKSPLCQKTPPLHFGNHFTQKDRMSIKNSQILIQLSKTHVIWSVIDRLHDEPNVLSFLLD
jgi:hypothetical protein